MNLPPSTPNPELDALMAKAKARAMPPMTPAELQAQRISYIFGMLPEGSTLTREDVAALDYAKYGNLAELTARAEAADVTTMEKARIGPHVTCPASRHAAMMAEALVKEQAYPMLAQDPAHCGETIAAVVTALWNARAEWSEAARSADQAEDEVARLRDILQFVEMFTATAHGLSSSDTMTIHRIAAEGRSDDPAAWRVDPAVIDQLRAAVSRVKGGGE